jgi:exopolyphosphatase / guanosine-5'-triphosphate,3'-diphosphate pyrophosphatase
MRVAVVDIGTNSTRLLIADVGPAGLAEHRRETTVTRLGEDVDATGRLGDAPQARVHAALGRYAAAIAEAGCEASIAVLTSAVRDSANGAGFARAVTERHGLDARILGGDEEAALTFAGATATRPAGDHAELVVVDIGGGSTELVCGADGRLGFHTSTQIGVVRHSERHLHSDPPAPAELAALARDAGETIAAAVPTAVRERAAAAVAVAGTATSCAAIDLGLDPYDAARVEGHVLARARIGALLAQLAALPLERCRAVRGLHPDRAPTIVAGVVVLGVVLDAFGLDSVAVSDRDILWGAALTLANSGPAPFGVGRTA